MRGLTIICNLAGTSPSAAPHEATIPMFAVIGNFLAGAVALSLFAATVRLSR